MVATTFAADTPLAVTELVAQGGIAGNWLWWNMLAGGMVTTFFFAQNWRKAQVLTDLEFIELRYHGRGAAILRGFRSLYFGLFMNALIIAWVNLAMMSLLKIFFPELEPYLIEVMAVLMIFVAIYSGLSGLFGVALTDMVQFVMAMVGCIILSILVLNSDKIGGITGLKASLAPETFSFFPKIHHGEGGAGHILSLGLGSFLTFIGIQWWASWYPGAEPGGGGYIAQRMMSAKDEKNSLYATLFFQIAHYCIRPWPWIIVALCSLVLYPELGVSDKKLGFVMAMKDFLPVGLRGLLFVAFLAAYMSTISTQINWGASYIVNDFYKRFIKTHDQSSILAARVATVFIMITGLFITTKIETISAVWSFIIECGAGLGLVFILRWYWWRINVWSEITATIAAIIGYGFSKFVLAIYDPSFSKGIIDSPKSFLFTVSFTTISWLLVTYLTKPESSKVLNSFVARVKPEGRWKGYQVDNSLLPIRFMTCFFAIVMAYSLLFGVGYGLFQEWTFLMICLGVFIISLFMTRRGIKKLVE